MSEAWNVQRDNLLTAWAASKDKLAAIKEEEMELRKQVSSMLFPEPKKGTQRYELGGGYKVKLVHKINYKLGDKDRIDPDNGSKIAINDQVETVMNEIEKIGNEGKFLVDRLIKTSYELSVSEYEKLENNEIKKLINSILITSDGAPSLELEEPKSSDK